MYIAKYIDTNSTNGELTILTSKSLLPKRCPKIKLESSTPKMTTLLTIKIELFFSSDKG